jgi:hypothetical protein
MENQLHLRITTATSPDSRPNSGSSNSDWQLDDPTRVIGRTGLALARAALAEARRAREQAESRTEQPNSGHTTAA